MKNIFTFVLMHLAFFVYSLYVVLAKFASSFEAFSAKWIFLFCGIFFVLGVYAILWQRVLKKIPLSVAMANKAAIVAWGLFWGCAIFGEKVSAKKIAGVILILAGILILAFSKNQSGEKK